MSNLIKHAERELELLGMGPGVEDGMNRAMREHILSVLRKVLDFEPVTPLTGEADEWTDLGYSEDMEAQNNRCSHVFRRADGTAYDSIGRVFRDPDGSCFTGRGSRVDITFPYTPTREYVDVDANGDPLDGTNREDYA